MTASNLEHERFTRLVRWVVDRCLLWAFAGFLAIACWMGWEHGAKENWVWGVVAICAIFLEVGSIHKFFEAKGAKEWTVAGAAACLWVVAFSYSFVQSLAVASNTADEASIKRVDYADTKQQNVKAAKDAEVVKTKAQAKVDHLTSLAWKPVPSIDGVEIKTEAAAEAIIQRLMGDQIYKRSKECANVSLPDSRELCGKIASAKAAKADVAERAKLAAEVKTAEAELKAAEQAHVDAVMKAQNTRSVSKKSGFQQIVGRVTGADAETVNDGIATQRTVTLNIALTLTALLLFGGVVPVSRRKDEDAGSDKGNGSHTVVVEKHNDKLRAQLAAFCHTINSKVAA